MGFPFLRSKADQAFAAPSAPFLFVIPLGIGVCSFFPP